MHNKNILIAPFSKEAKNWEIENWKELVNKVKEKYGYNVLQIGTFEDTQIKGTDIIFRNRSFEEIKKLIQNSRLIISVDSFLQHFCKTLNKKCIVIWGPSDSNIFGYKDNVNIHGNKEYLRKYQFHLWAECEPIDKSAFPSVEEVLKEVDKILS